MPLIRSAGGTLLGWALGEGGEALGEGLLTRCWQHPGHPLGPDTTTVIELDGQVVASLTGDAAPRWTRAERAHPVSLDGLGRLPILLAFQERLNQQRSARPELPDAAWYLSSLGVLPAFRRRGLARMLLARATQRARAHRRTHILVEVVEDNLEAGTLYRSAGFSEVLQWRAPGGPNVVRLVRDV